MSRRTRPAGRARSWIALSAVVLLNALAGVCTAASADDAAADAKRVLASSGVRGGLVVHVGCDDGKLTAALHAGGSFLVHGLDRDASRVCEARSHIRSVGLYGPVSVHHWTTAPRLPYAENLVNVAVVTAGQSVSRDELLRILAPGGVACLRQGDDWTTIRKPRPSNIDDWTHVLGDATNNAVAADAVVGPPHHVQWVGGPRNARHHEGLATVTVVVVGGGRLFYIVDEAPAASILLGPAWALVARDAFSGVVLWKRPISTWHPHLHPFRSGPVALARRLVATDRCVYATLGVQAPVTALDPATGQTVATYEGTEGTEEIVLADDVLYMVVTRPSSEVIRKTPDQRTRTVMAIDASSGGELWKTSVVGLQPASLAVGGGRVCYLDGRGLAALDAKTGHQLWHTPRRVAKKRPGWSAPTVVVHDDVVLCADRQAAPAPNLDESTGKKMAAWLAQGGHPGDLVAYAAVDGKELWRCRCGEAYHAPIDVFVVDGAVWYGQSRARHGPDFTVARDLHTGEIVRRIQPDKAFDTTMPHHRCYRNRATSRYIVAGRTGVEFVDLKTGEARRHHWTRGTCQFGTVPCNGLLYVPPHSCACYIEAKLTGFYALAPASAEAPSARTTPSEPAVPAEGASDRLERGNAYASIGSRERQADRPGEWPTYRHDAARSGCTKTSVPTRLHAVWRAKLGGRLTSPVIADGVVLAGSVDTHTVCALDVDSGRELWRFTAGGRVDSPPSISQGLAVFGSADGYVYCLRLSDGKLVWRFRAALTPRLIVAFGQLESPWPVHGSVLIQDGAVSFAAGRSSYIDNGIVLYRLDLKTGRLLSQKRIYSRGPGVTDQPGEPIMFEMPGALPDVLSSDGKQVYMRRLAFDPHSLEPQKARPHLYSPAGLLNGDWWHRTYWIYGDHFYSGYIGWYFAGRENAAGRLLAMSDRMIYGYGYRPSYYRGSTGRQYHLYATERKSLPDPGPPDYRRANRDYPHSGGGKFRVTFAWKQNVPLLARAMVLAKDTLFLAGPPERALRSIPTFEGKRGTMLMVASAEDGKTLGQYKLDALPVYDGLVAAQGRLFVSLKNGTLLCLGGPDPDKGTQPLEAWAVAPKKTAGQPKEPGLVGHWPLDEGAGSTSADRSGLGNDAEVTGQWVKGAFGTCLHTKGIPGAVTIWDSSAIQFGTDSFSMAFWVKPDRYDRRLLGKEAYPRTWWVINLLPDGRAELVLGTGRGEGKSVRLKSKTPLSQDTWTHVAFVVDRPNRTVACHINGHPDSTTKIPPTLTASLSVEGKDLMIPSAHKPFAGLFDNLRLYRRVLTPAEVKALYEKEKRP